MRARVVAEDGRGALSARRRRRRSPVSAGVGKERERERVEAVYVFVARRQNSGMFYLGEIGSGATSSTAAMELGVNGGGAASSS